MKLTNLLLLALVLGSCSVYKKVPALVSRKQLLQRISFQTGTIDIDLRGRNVYQRSFLGMIFNASDTDHYESVYFRPFNFGVSDGLRHNHAVQYMRLPNEPWSKLRTEYPLQFEHAVYPEPEPDHWFHATIRVTKDSVLVFVDHAQSPSLRVKRFADYVGLRFGLFVDGMPGEFRNLRIRH